MALDVQAKNLSIFEVWTCYFLKKKFFVSFRKGYFKIVLLAQKIYSYGIGIAEHFDQVRIRPNDQEIP